MFDTHAHLNFKDFDRDREEVIKNLIAKKFFVINVGTGIKESQEVLDIADNYDSRVYASVGLHPLYVKEDFNYKEYKALAQNKKVVAIGETGLDYQNLSTNKDKAGERKALQKKVLLSQIELACELNLPLIIHCRKAHKDLIEILKAEKKQRRNLRGVIHCFTGTLKEAKDYIDLDFFLGINGIIFKFNMKEVLLKTSLSKIVLETDCPFLSPKKEILRNEPLFLDDIAQEIAVIKNTNKEDVVNITTENALRLFEIK